MMAFEKMRMLKLRCVISTDLMSRGVDLPDVQIVVNLDLPQHRSKDVKGSGGVGWPKLVHRIGRAGRFGSKAMAINFVQDSDLTIQSNETSTGIATFPTKSIEELVALVKSQINQNQSLKSDVNQSQSRV